MLDPSHDLYLSRFRDDSAPLTTAKSEKDLPKPSTNEYASGSRLAKAYEVALDIRKFEIGLYWQRSNNFWLIIAALGAALLAALSAKELDPNTKSLVAFAICAFASVVAYAWSLVNRAGKFWQRNWEYQVDVLEDAVLGPLYKTVFSKKSPTLERLYSVSKLNLALSRCVSVFFLLGAAVSFPLVQPWADSASLCMWAKYLFMVFAAGASLYISSTGKAESSKTGVNNLQLHYTRREVDSLVEH